VKAVSTGKVVTDVMKGSTVNSKVSR